MGLHSWKGYPYTLDPSSEYTRLPSVLYMRVLLHQPIYFLPWLNNIWNCCVYSNLFTTAGYSLTFSANVHLWKQDAFLVAGLRGSWIQPGPTGPSKCYIRSSKSRERALDTHHSVRHYAGLLFMAIQSCLGLVHKCLRHKLHAIPNMVRVAAVSLLTRDRATRNSRKKADLELLQPIAVQHQASSKTRQSVYPTWSFTLIVRLWIWARPFFFRQLLDPNQWISLLSFSSMWVLDRFQESYYWA